MALKTFKPYTKSNRALLSLIDLNCGKGHLQTFNQGQNFTGGRNNNGRITSRHIGGGSKHRFRIIDFLEKKKHACNS